MVQVLIEKGADVNKEKNHGTTLLYTAAYHGHEAVVQILKDAGAV